MHIVETMGKSIIKPLFFLLASISYLHAAGESIIADTQVSENTPIHSLNNSREVLIEELIVRGSYLTNNRLNTATGLGLTPLETPQSVNIMTFQRIEDQGLRSLAHVVNQAPGLASKAYDSSRNAFSARGFDVDSYQIDGIPVQWESGASAGETQSDMTLYERVEIVRGATGLLTGVGQPSASINLVRKHATSKVFSGYLATGIGRWNKRNIHLDLGAPLNDSASLRGRTVMVYEQGDSFVDFAANKKQVAYGVLDMDLADATVLSVGLSYQDNQPLASQWGGLPIFFSDGSRTDWPRSKTVGAEWTHWASTHKTQFATVSHDLSDDWTLQINANRTQSLSDMRLLFLFGSPDPLTGLGMGASPRRYDNERTQDDVGLRLNGAYNLFGRQHDLVLGASFSEQDFIYQGFERGSFPAVPNFLLWDGTYPQPEWGASFTFDVEVTRQTGYFAATRLFVNEAFTLILGGRVVDWSRQGEHYDEDIDYGETGVVVPYAGLLYAINERHNFYASYTEIFQPQNFRDARGVYLDALLGKNYEIGLKSTFFNDALHATATLFHIDQEGLAVEDETFTPNLEQLTAYRSAKGINSEGLELEVVGELRPGWLLSASYTEFKATEMTADGVESAINTRFPRRLMRLFTRYSQGKFDLGGGFSWEGENYTKLSNPATGDETRVTQGAFALVSLMVRYQASEALSIQLNVDNLLDKTYYSQIGFFDQLAYGEPRNLNLNLKYQF